MIDIIFTLAATAIDKLQGVADRRDPGDPACRVETLEAPFLAAGRHPYEIPCRLMGSFISGACRVEWYVFAGVYRIIAIPNIYIMRFRDDRPKE